MEKVSDKVTVGKLESCDWNIPEKSGKIRGKYHQVFALVQTDTGTKIVLYIADNPGGSIPAWIINWGSERALPEYLKVFEDACEKYISEKIK